MEVSGGVEGNLVRILIHSGGRVGGPWRGWRDFQYTQADGLEVRGGNLVLEGIWSAGKFFPSFPAFFSIFFLKTLNPKP